MRPEPATHEACTIFSYTGGSTKSDDEGLDGHEEEKLLLLEDVVVLLKEPDEGSTSSLSTPALREEDERLESRPLLAHPARGGPIAPLPSAT